MTNVEEYVRSWDGLHLLYRKSMPEGTPSAKVLLVHGFGEHSARYERVVERLTKQGTIVHTFDLRGHGYSGGPRADGLFEWFLQDIDFFYNKALAEDSDALPLYLYGHSMGGLLTIRYLQTRPAQRIAGAIIASPLLRLVGKKHPPLWKRLALRVGSPVLAEVLINSNVDPCSLASCRETTRRVFNDRLSLPFMTVRFANQMMTNCSAAMSQAGSLHYPIFMMHGDGDVVTCPNATVQFSECVGSTDVTLLIVKGGLHELHNDAEHEETMSLAADWLKKKTAEFEESGSDAAYEVLTASVAAGEDALNKAVEASLYGRAHKLMDQLYHGFWFDGKPMDFTTSVVVTVGFWWLLLLWAMFTQVEHHFVNFYKEAACYDMHTPTNVKRIEESPQ
eukprot:GFYU01007981.1.p1 GENE.GFYU01007981.1~~GFYU01007981.1.p1  ORF type:complete len:392 (-),score=105.02 GFYU01007981.1:29-1204(-)